MSISFRVIVDSSTNAWKLKNSNQTQLAEAQHYKLMQSRSVNQLNTSMGMVHSSSYNSGLSAVVQQQRANLSLFESPSMPNSAATSKRRSSSTSYLNEQDDYGENDGDIDSGEKSKNARKHLTNMSNMKKSIQRQRSLDNKLADKNEQSKSIENLDDNKSGALANQIERTASNPEIASDENEKGNEKEAASQTSSSSSSDEAISDEEDELYAIDEYDETIQTVDVDPGKYE
jgi:hypothetical protein